LADRVPRIPKRAALGIAPRDRYWLHVFDALAVALAVDLLVSRDKLTKRELRDERSREHRS
jgi:hypothetical protein